MDKKNMPPHLRIKHLLSDLCGLQISGWQVPAAQKIIDRLAVIADELQQAGKAELSTEDPILSPEHQTQQALMRAASVKDGREAATWAVAAAVFSLRDTVAEAMNAKAAVPAEPDRSQLTPEEVESIRRGPVGYMPVVEPAPRPPVTREAVTAIVTGSSDMCRQDAGSCGYDPACYCRRTIDALMALIGDAP